jgi:hypothetical protein
VPSGKSHRTTTASIEYSLLSGDMFGPRAVLNSRQYYLTSDLNNGSHPSILLAAVDGEVRSRVLH